MGQIAADRGPQGWTTPPKLPHNESVRHRAGFLPAVLVSLVWIASAAPASAQDALTSVDDLLSDGWHQYSEELEFEAALQFYEEATQHPDANDEQLLEALEYVAACRFALGDQEAAREAMVEMLHISRDHQLTDPSHSPDLLQMLEELRTDLPPAEPEPVEPPIEPETPTFSGETGEGGGDEGSVGRRPVYRRWWFWTLIGLVVVGAGVGVGVGVGASGGIEEPPMGSLDPGVVQLPCVARF